MQEPSEPLDQGFDRASGDDMVGAAIVIDSEVQAVAHGEEAEKLLRESLRGFPDLGKLLWLRPWERADSVLPGRARLRIQIDAGTT